MEKEPPREARMVECPHTIRMSLFSLDQNGIRDFFVILHPLAQVAKLVDAPSSGGGAARCAGSNPVLGTNAFPTKLEGRFYLEATQAYLLEPTNENAPVAEGS